MLPKKKHFTKRTKFIFCTSDFITIALFGMYETTISSEKQIDNTCVNIDESQVNFFSFPLQLQASAAGSGLEDVKCFC